MHENLTPGCLNPVISKDGKVTCVRPYAILAFQVGPNGEQTPVCDPAECPFSPDHERLGYRQFALDDMEEVTPSG